MEQPQILDQQGQPRDWNWLKANFGDVRLTRTEVPEGVSRVYRVVRMQDAVGPSIQLVQVEDPGGTPLVGVRVARHWPDAPPLPNWPAPTSRWYNEGVFGETKEEGHVGFGLGRGDYYYAPGGGASAVWVAAEDGPADMVSGLGMLGGTEHRHLDITYERQGLEAPRPEESEAEAERWEALVTRLDRIISLLQELQVR